MRLRNIEKQFAWLRKQGFSNDIATQLVRGECKSVKLEHLQLLCHRLRCQLTDLFTYIPDPSAPETNSDTLLPLVRSAEPPGDLNDILRQLPIDRIESLTRELATDIPAPH
jgi:DNA-binding Xre family transcriptional regulator